MRMRIGSPLAVTAVALVVVLCASVAKATIPDASGVIHGCFKTLAGKLRVIDPTAGGTCSFSETSLDWNLQGPQGSQGPQGPQGLQGPQGPPGSSGYEQVSAQFTTDQNGHGQGEVVCPNGKRPVMGGFELIVGLRSVKSEPNLANTGWVAEVTGKSNGSFEVFAICVFATTP